jgi:hypothetical protein
MKTTLIILLFSASVIPGLAQWAVIDAANLQQSAVNYAALVKQLANQATQISHQIQQIQHFETQLKRLGDMATVKDLVGFPEFHADLNLPTKAKIWSEGVQLVDGKGLFGDTRAGIFVEVTAEFPDFDGTGIKRDAEIYKEVHDITVSVDEFKTVQSDVYTRRQALKAAIADTSEALRLAETEAEQKKLAAVLNAQYGQLDAVDTEVMRSAAQVQVKAVESGAMSQAHQEADAETRRRLAQQEAKKITTAFKPQYESLLQYVTEKPFSP